MNEKGGCGGAVRRKLMDEVVRMWAVDMTLLVDDDSPYRPFRCV
jgi:hypothetical protein